MKIDVYPEVVFSTARSGGKGGQNVNKVETMVEGRWKVMESRFFSLEQKQLIESRLANKITSEGFLLVKSQADRTQLGNKAHVMDKIHSLIAQALHKKKARISTKVPKGVKEKRIGDKKLKGGIKENRKKLSPGTY